MQKDEILTQIELTNGDTCLVKLATGYMISRAVRLHSMQADFDITPFIMQECCLIDGKRMDKSYYLSLTTDNYFNIESALVASIIKLD